MMRTLAIVVGVCWWLAVACVLVLGLGPWGLLGALVMAPVGYMLAEGIDGLGGDR